MGEHGRGDGGGGGVSPLGTLGDDMGLPPGVCLTEPVGKRVFRLYSQINEGIDKSIG